MIPVETLKAFAEHTLRPLVDDTRQILEKAKELGFPVNEYFLKALSRELVRTHIIVECLRAVTYVLVTLIVCWTCYLVLN